MAGRAITQDALEYEPSLPPAYRDEDIPVPPPEYRAASSLYYRHFPSIMTIKAGWSKSFTICNTHSNEDLYFAEFHPFNWFCTKPLGPRAGFILHNGTSREDAALAAVGDITLFEQRINAFSNKSHILLPPLPQNDKRQASRDVTETETMTARSVANNGVIYQFCIEVGRAMKRERFEWRRSDEEGVAWKLVRCPSSSRKVPPEGEIIATLSWVPVLLATVLNPLSSKAVFTLQFMNSLESGALGERCALTVVMSALRLWQQRTKGKDKRSYVRIGERMGED
ncbi:uncharacterized protein TRIVIDRAFT_65009 [Trichoderma virens Gv29-8]|uniref:Uncharacterized protein n=1 Tax=Hypocrea virens (strain Gv29-8 / FGSC 10586) TaxID=413071 RepID=G9NBH3_HYPVG|nr:uncharacterized protein TRIVIDRAFT_65009 [Trichoderma virens Gv29-8]EHK16178.1 hypothetical protein TRIVIDRAFT_65009 [Trichoderma virens Gv29-8]UKZ56046.1 hypothetical protein TrVGV298_009871 [Trichoderma virens]